MEPPASNPLPASAGKIIEVAAGLIFQGGQLLITQRRPGDHLGGLWEFPGGKREPGESYEECLRREIREELGIEVETGPLFSEVLHHYPEKSVRLRFFLCSCSGQAPSAIACHDFAWVGQDTLDQYTFPAADKVVLQKLKASPQRWQDVKSWPLSAPE